MFPNKRKVFYFRSPRSLYASSLQAVAAHFRHFRLLILESPESVRFDIFAEIYEMGRMSLLWEELSSLETFLGLLKVGDKRTRLHQMFQSVIDHGESLQRTLSSSCCSDGGGGYMISKAEALHFSSFLSEGGWFLEAKRVLLPFYDPQSPCPLVGLSLLQFTSSYCEFAEAEELARSLLLPLRHPHPSAVYSQFSASAFERSEYTEAFRWSRKAVMSLTHDLPLKVVIDVFRQASKSYVVRRQFAKAKMLILEALWLARETYGEVHPKVADCLLDYGYYLLNADRVIKSLQAYKSALEVRQKCFGSQNLQVAIALEGLSYATYVNQYNTGQFERAKGHAEKALSIMNALLPKSHLLLASSQRVLALIIEEIAVDHGEQEVGRKLLRQAESLHRSAISLSIKSFGEINVQTAKHYGNLGRLNQSMKRYGKAEKMHLKAIKIKEKLLGDEDHEVALSVGHLASLYTYDLKEYAKAELLYLRSIQIGVKLFGPGYSGLEYDYRGLIRVYQETEDWPNYFVYTYKLREWEELQGLRNHEEAPSPKNNFGSNPSHSHNLQYHQGEKRSPLPLSSIIQALEEEETPSLSQGSYMESAQN